MAHDFPLLMAAAKDGLGVVLLPELTCAEAIRTRRTGSRAAAVEPAAGHLPRDLPQSRRGLLPAVRVFIDFLAERLPTLIERHASLKCGAPGGLPCDKQHAHGWIMSPSRSPKRAKTA